MFPIEYETARLRVREIEASDWEGAHALDSDPRVVRYMSYDVTDEQGTRDYLSKSIAAARVEPRSVYDLALTLRGDATYVGRIGFAIRRPEHREAELWYQLRPDLWGNGYVYEALVPLVDRMFSVLGLHRVMADCDPRNLGSVAVARKLGMTLEGKLRENWFLRGEWCDSHIYGLLENEWSAR